ncbi:MAG: GHKL domain-containing protein [Erysipelotrichaceae bacterium]
MFSLFHFILLTASDIVIPFFTIETLSGKKMKFNKGLYFIILCLLIMFLRFINVHYIILEIIVLALTSFTVKKDGKRPSLLYLNFFTIINLLILPIVNIVSFFFFNGYMDIDYSSFGNLFSSNNTEFICKMLYLLILLIMQSQRLEKSSVFEKKYWQSLYVFICVSLTSLIAFIVISVNFHNKLLIALSSTLAATTIILFYIFKNFFVSLYENVIQNRNLIIEKEKTKMQIQALIDNQQHLEELKKFKHDIQNNFIIIKHMIIEKQYNAAMRYLNEYADTFESLNIYVQTDSIIVSAIVNDKIKRYPTISFDLRSWVPAEMKINDLDLVTILGNLIDNACEYMLKNNLTEFVSIKLIAYGDTELFIEISNPCLETKLTDDFLKTKKSDADYHGYGITNVQSAVDKYEGLYNCKIEEGKFIAQILIPEGGK